VKAIYCKSKFCDIFVFEFDERVVMVRYAGPVSSLYRPADFEVLYPCVTLLSYSSPVFHRGFIDANNDLTRSHPAVRRCR
jgi:hypothetical protein